MAHYAFLDENNIVTEVIVGRDEWEVVNGISDWEEYYGSKRGQRCVRTSYNNNIRGIFAGIGFKYDEENDIFVSPSPFPSWIWNEEVKAWMPPSPMPDDGNMWEWNEETVSWVPGPEIGGNADGDIDDEFID